MIRGVWQVLDRNELTVVDVCRAAGVRRDAGYAVLEGRYRLFPRLALTLYRLLPADDYAELLRRLGFPEAANEAPQDPSPGTRDARTAVKAALRGP